MKRIFLLLVISAVVVSAQQWKRKVTNNLPRENLFSYTLAGQLPTTTVLKNGDIQYEISHRFIPSISEGSETNWGFDGPVNMRMALSYGISNNLMLTLGRSNLMDNYDLRAKLHVYQSTDESYKFAIALQGGIAVNTETPDILDRSTFDSDNIQFYLQGVFNALLMEDKLGLGVVPSYLYNSIIFSVEKQYTFNLGTYAQYFLNRMFSLRIEFMPVVAGYQGVIEAGESGRSYNTLSFNFDIETGGHLFQLMLTNNLRLNPSQYLVGANNSASSGDWHIGFGIMRVF